jgi:GAF domain-containing protein
MRAQVDRLKSQQEVLGFNCDPTRNGRLMDFYVRIATRLTDAERCSIFIHDPAHDQVWLKCGTGVGEKQIQVPKDDSIVGQVIATGKPVMAADLDKREGIHRAVDASTGFVTRDTLCVPIRACGSGEVTGAIQVLNKKGGGTFGNDDRALLEEMAEHLQQSIEGVYLSQTALGMCQSMVRTASRIMAYSVLTVVGILGLTFGIYAASPVLFG